jgi:hypothetical protein
VLPFLGYFFNEPTKSSLIGKKSPDLVTLITGQFLKKDFGAKAERLLRA